MMVFWLSIVAWFWAGMVLAPLTVWLGSAAIAGALARGPMWPYAPYLAGAAVVLILTGLQYRAARRRAVDREVFKARQGYFADSLAQVQVKAAAEPIPGQRELTSDQLTAVRFVLDRALQPLEQFKGFTIIDQFQPAALRYQINHMGFALGLVQAHYTPSFHGYLAQAQRNLIEKYRQPRVWRYWVYESMWGHFNFRHHDPVVRDNIMLSGWYGMHAGLYTLVTGDRRYAEPGALTFALGANKRFEHNLHSIADAVARNFRSNPYVLFPCEPNWVYPICNMYGMSSLATHDATFGTAYVKEILPRWLDVLHTEFTDLKGSIIPLRSKWTGLAMPFYNGEAGFAFFANVFSPPLARRLWAIGRKELGFCLASDSNGKTRLTLPMDQLPFQDKIDPGHYKPGLLFAYAAVMMCAREFGDDELAEAAEHSMDQDCERILDNGALSYARGSCLANVWAVEGKLMRTGDFRNAFTRCPLPATLTGPILGGAAYPDVLVAKAFSRGHDLELVLYPGASDGPQEIVLERLRPGEAYSISGAISTVASAGADGRLKLVVPLRGRTPLYIRPPDKAPK